MADSLNGTAQTNPWRLRRDIGLRFARLRDLAGLSQTAAAERLQIGVATLRRLEGGNEGVRFTDHLVEAMLKLYQVAPDSTDWRELFPMTAETRNGKSRSWWQDFTDTELPKWFNPYVKLEDRADLIRRWDTGVPGLLQTAAYAELIMRVPTGLLDENEIQRRVQVRMGRKSLLTRAKPRAPQLQVVISESALDLCRGMGDLGREQLQHMVEMAGQPNVEVRMVPWAAGFAVTAAGGAFSLLTFSSNTSDGSPAEPPVAYVESPTNAMYLTKPAEVDVFELIWADLLTHAHNTKATRLAITKALEGLPK